MYEVQVCVLVLSKGPSDILNLPGFRINGSITNNARFQLAENFSVNVDLAPEETDTISPVTAYQSGLVFPFVEDFEGNHFLSNDRDGDAETNIDPDEPVPPVGTTLPAFTVHNFGAGALLFETAGIRHDVTLWIENLADELYAEFSNASFFRPEPGSVAKISYRLGF